MKLPFSSVKFLDDNNVACGGYDCELTRLSLSGDKWTFSNNFKDPKGMDKKYLHISNVEKKLRVYEKRSNKKSSLWLEILPKNC